jgi:nitronate monooxygenase
VETAFTRLVGCRHPIQQAGMGGVTTPQLAAAVTNAGGLGMVNLTMGPADVRSSLDLLHGMTTGPVGANFLMPFLDVSAVDVAADECRLVEFFYGAPDRLLVDRVHAGGALAAWQVGSVEEARAAEAGGCDLVIAQGSSAGGHVRGTVDTLALLEAVLDACPLPVLAAGGIGTARALAGVLAAGAAGARVGTRFVAAAESAAHPLYVDALIRSGVEDTELTTAFSVMWPDAPHRVLRSSLDALDAHQAEVVGETTVGTARVPLPRAAVTPPTRETTGAIEAMALYAGQSVHAVHQVSPAAEIVQELVDGAMRLLSTWTGDGR